MYKSKNHSKFSLKAHLVFVTKYRKPLLKNNLIVNQLRLKLADIEARSDFNIELAEVDKDHIHILVDYEPKVSILQIVRRLKQETTFTLWRLFEEKLRKHYYKERIFWSDGYFVCSIGVGASYETIQKYISSQG